MRSILTLFLVFGFTLGSAETITFDTARPGFVPAGWTVTSTDAKFPRWQVVVDRSAPSRPCVLAQLPARNERAGYNVAIFQKKSLQDGEISVDFKLISGKVDQSAGLVWRFQDSANYYFARASADRSNVGIYKKSNNAVSLVAHASIPHQVDDREWNVLKVLFRGPRFTLYFGHRKLIEAQDTTLANAGLTGLWTKADTTAYFDNFRIDKRN